MNNWLTVLARTDKEHKNVFRSSKQFEGDIRTKTNILEKDSRNLNRSSIKHIKNRFIDCANKNIYSKHDKKSIFVANYGIQKLVI